MEKLFKKVEIKSEADFPQKGNHWMSRSMSVFWYEEAALQFLDWKDFDFYFLELPESKRSADSLKKILNRFGYTLKTIIHNYHETWKGEWEMDKVIDEFLKEEGIDVFQPPSPEVNEEIIKELQAISDYMNEKGAVYGYGQISDLITKLKSQKQPEEKGVKPSDDIVIPKWQMVHIEDTLRITSNTLHSASKETCLDRCVCKAWGFAKKALNIE
jgi:hypothetical protein